MKGWATSLSKDSTFLILCVCHFPTLEHKVCARCHSRFGNFPTLIVGQASIPACNQAYYYYANWLLQRRLCILFLRTYYYLMDCAISLSLLCSGDRAAFLYCVPASTVHEGVGGEGAEYIFVCPWSNKKNFNFRLLPFFPTEVTELSMLRARAIPFLSCWLWIDVYVSKIRR